LGCAGCEKGVYRKNIKSHVNDKLLVHVMMQNAQMRSLERQLLEYHSINTQFKTQLEEVKRDKEHLEERMARLEAKISKHDIATVVSKPQHPAVGCLAAHITGTVRPIGANFTMTDFDEYKGDNDRWFSLCFYTHPNGYKMCLGVDANGSGSGFGTHLSVYVCLMKGEFDDQLKWPFQGDMHIKLVNQEEDRDHVIRIFPSRVVSIEHCKRVMTKERSNNGWGMAEFLPHAKLQPKYLKNNCIQLCIKKVDFY
jgi:hypothetical protein